MDNVCICFNEIPTAEHECSCFMFRPKRSNLLRRLGKLSEHEGKREDENSMDINEFSNSVLKKLRTKSLESLLQALENKNMTVSECIKIPKDVYKMDKPMLALHALFCKLWRWSDLRSEDILRSLPYCFSSDKSEVCCNPYHWSIALQAGKNLCHKICSLILKRCSFVFTLCIDMAC